MKKIMFNDRYGLTRAVLEGRKTQTRRIVSESTLRKANLEVKICGGSIEERIVDQTRYCFGEEIAIAQNYYTIFNDEPTVTKEAKGYAYRMGFRPEASWGNKMFVRAQDMPHHIKITDINIT